MGIYEALSGKNKKADLETLPSEAFSLALAHVAC
jgi:hypothetical protein